MTETTAITKATISAGERGLQLSSIDEMWRFSQAVAKSGLAPKGIESPEAILVAIQMGAEVGLSPMAAMQNIAVINGRPSIWGDAQLAICRASSQWDDSAFEEIISDNAAACTVKRINGKPITRTFTVDDAKKAGLWGKSGPWSQYPKRMLQLRARSFALRDGFGDVLKGFKSVEEVRDYDLKPADARIVDEPQASATERLAAKLKATEAPVVEEQRSPTVEEAAPASSPAAQAEDLTPPPEPAPAPSSPRWTGKIINVLPVPNKNGKTTSWKIETDDRTYFYVNDEQVAADAESIKADGIQAEIEYTEKPGKKAGIVFKIASSILPLVEMGN